MTACRNISLLLVFVLKGRVSLFYLSRETDRIWQDHVLTQLCVATSAPCACCRTDELRKPERKVAEPRQTAQIAISAAGIKRIFHNQFITLEGSAFEFWILSSASLYVSLSPLTGLELESQPVMLKSYLSILVTSFIQFYCQIFYIFLILLSYALLLCIATYHLSLSFFV